MAMTWSDLAKKQPAAMRILMNGIRNNRLAHAYLFSGGRGVGKREAASHLARAFFCRARDGIEPCGACPDCKRIDSGNHPDVVVIQPDGRSIKKPQIASLIKAFSYKGVETSKKLFIIEQADLLTSQAANSLLKFIEEPQGNTLCILITEHSQKILATILSRCQVLHFKPLSKELLVHHLLENGVSRVMAKTASAVTSDAEEATTLSKDEWFANSRSIVLHFMEDLLTRPNHAIITMYEKCALHFNDSDKMKMMLRLMLIWFRDVMALHIGQKDNVVYVDKMESLTVAAEKMTAEQAACALSLLMEAQRRLQSNGNPLSVLEYVSLKLQEGAGVYA